MRGRRDESIIGMKMQLSYIYLTQEQILPYPASLHLPIS